jgi:hypothetical protein|tara:strand:+ start:2941 stop:4344 length:1404 start_codon:yes stop_codon:yes gene_type:complete
MADNTVADLPTKNAAPAEPAKSLQATVQQVMTKAVTSPTDAKVDFAQGVNHITGDPQQKSAGTADAMPTLKAEADPKKSYSNANEAEEKKDKEKEDMKEVADKEDEKKKDDMKEGEMPAGLKKYLDKKSDKSENKEDEKKDVKEEDAYDKDDEKKDKKEMMKASKDKEDMKEGEMPKAALDALNKSKDKEVKEVADKEDEKKKEVSEIMDKEKEVKKETAKDKVKDMDMKEDVAALTEGEDLSEEFKAKAATIFEASIKAKLVEEIENLESEYETKVNEKVEETKSEIVEKVDAYLNYVVEEWMKENELAIEKGLRAEITEDFIGGLKSLFESHYINVPQEKYDVIEAQTAEIEKLKEEVNSTIEKNVELNQSIGQHVRQDIINDVTSDLAETETEKLKGLAEGIEYKDAESFRTSIETLKNSYYPKAKASDTESNEVAENNAGSMNESMAAYTAAISKSNKNPYVK